MIQQNGLYVLLCRAACEEPRKYKLRSKKPAEQPVDIEMTQAAEDSNASEQDSAVAKMGSVAWATTDKPRGIDISDNGKVLGLWTFQYSLKGYEIRD